MTIRIAQINDLPKIVDIYNQAIHTKSSTADLTPIQVEDRQDWFALHTPQRYPIFLAEVDYAIAGWCSVSPYRPGRMALRFTAEISTYIDRAFHRQGVATRLINHAISECPKLQIKTLFGILLEKNIASRLMLEKLDFQKWGFLPRVADFDGEECGHFYYGKRILEDVEQDDGANDPQRG